MNVFENNRGKETRKNLFIRGKKVQIEYSVLIIIYIYEYINLNI